MKIASSGQTYVSARAIHVGCRARRSISVIKIHEHFNPFISGRRAASLTITWKNPKKNTFVSIEATVPSETPQKDANS